MKGWKVGGMNTRFTIPILFLIAGFGVMLVPLTVGASTIVNPSAHISDTAVRHKLAEIWSMDSSTWPLALVEYRRLLDGDDAGRRDVWLAAARLANRMGEYELAQGWLNELLAEDDRDAQVLAEAGVTQARRGRAVVSRRWFEAARAAAENTAELRDIDLMYADSRMSWGDFHAVERTLRGYQEVPESHTPITRRLAAVLTAAERYEEAEAIYRRLLHTEPGHRELQLELIRLKWMALDFEAVIRMTDEWFAAPMDGTANVSDTFEAEARLLAARALARQFQFEWALPRLRQLTERTEWHTAAWMEIGHIETRRGYPEQAAAAFAAALAAAPTSVAAQVHVALANAWSLDWLLELRSPERLTAAGQILTIEGQTPLAVALYRQALMQDADYFPARLALAETLAYSGVYAQAEEQYRRLLDDLPGTSKLLIGMARVQSWAGQYAESLETYQMVIASQPADPAPYRELARVALWGKKPETAWETYNQLRQPPLDEILRPHLEQLHECLDRAEREELASQASHPSGYAAYETLHDILAGWPPSACQERLQGLLLHYYADYAIQKSFLMEKQAKRYAWHKQDRQALTAYQELLLHQPGNQEVAFDLAQVRCRVGACTQEVYQHLLSLDPLHNRAHLALARERIRQRPAVRGSYGYWHETGRGDLADITRRQEALQVSWPLAQRYAVRLAGRQGTDTTRAGNRHWQGHLMELEGRLGTWTHLGAGWESRFYRTVTPQPPDVQGGWLRAGTRLGDVLMLNLELARRQQAANEVALQQAITTDTLGLSIQRDLTRRLRLTGLLNAGTYSDANRAWHGGLLAEYALTDHPRTLTLGLRGDYRHTRHESRFLYEGLQLRNIVHPYWTPQQYYAGQVSVTWRHDYANPLFCGGAERFYELQVFAGTDSEHNPALNLEGRWHHEFTPRLTLALSGSLHRSSEWKAEGLAVYLNYAFGATTDVALIRRADIRRDPFHPSDADTTTAVAPQEDMSALQPAARPLTAELTGPLVAALVSETVPPAGPAPMPAQALPETPPASENTLQQPHFAVQLGAFASAANAERLMLHWQKQGYGITTYFTETATGAWLHVVRFGTFDTQAAAADAARRFKDIEGAEAIPVAVTYVTTTLKKATRP